MSWPVEHMGVTGVAGGGTLALLALAFKDVFREWWRDYHAERQAERARRMGQKEGGALAHELLAILRQDLQSNRDQINQLTSVLGRLTSAIEHLASVADDTHHMVKETRDNTMVIKGAVS